VKAFRTHLSQGGRVVIPADYREALGLKPGDDVMLVLEENEVRLITPHQAVKRAQSLVRQYVPPGRTLTEELLADRRQEVRRDKRKRTTVARRS
jgi:AbrB family looped-hinge helix DNA binding protein